jgi:7-keto-8-aminopelargonate synthetase-like enzyme
VTKYIYLFVRADLLVPQQIIQVAHAVDNLNATPKNSHMVLFTVKNEHALMMAAEYLLEEGIHHVMFNEPDIDAYTAIATQALSGDERKLTRKFKMMTYT